MKKTSKAKRPVAAKAAATPTVTSPIPPASTTVSAPTPTPNSVVGTPPFDPELEELAYDERGDAYLRSTPRGMLEEALGQVNQRELADYRDSIKLLRHKGFSFREIAVFLTDRGMRTDHNAVYRIYEKFMTPEDMLTEADIEKEEQQQAFEDGE